MKTTTSPALSRQKLRMPMVSDVADPLSTPNYIYRAEAPRGVNPTSSPTTRALTSRSPPRTPYTSSGASVASSTSPSRQYQSSKRTPSASPPRTRRDETSRAGSPVGSTYSYTVLSPKAPRQPGSRADESEYMRGQKQISNLSSSSQRRSTDQKRSRSAAVQPRQQDVSPPPINAWANYPKNSKTSAALGRDTSELGFSPIYRDVMPSEPLRRRQDERNGTRNGESSARSSSLERASKPSSTPMSVMSQGTPSPSAVARRDLVATPTMAPKTTYDSHKVPAGDSPVTFITAPLDRRSRVGDISDSVQKKRVESLISPPGGRSSPIDSYDETLASLFEELHFASSQVLEEKQTNLVGTTAVLNTISDVMDSVTGSPQNISGTPYAFRSAPGALKRTVEAFHKCDPQAHGVGVSPDSLCALAAVTKKKNTLMDTQFTLDEPRADSSASDLSAGLIPLLACGMAGPDSTVFRRADFCADSMLVLSNALSSPSTRAAVLDILEAKPGVLQTANAAMNPKGPAYLRKAALDFAIQLEADDRGKHLANTAAPQLHNHAKAAMEPVNLDVLMTVVRRKIVNADNNVESNVNKLKRRNTFFDMMAAEPVSPVGDMENPQDFVMPTELGAIINCIIQGNIPRDQSNDLAKQFTELVTQYATRGRAKEITDLNGHLALLALMKKYPEDPNIIEYCLNAFGELADQSNEMKQFCASKVLFEVLPETCLKDIDCCESYVALLEDLTAVPDPAMNMIPVSKVMIDLAALESGSFATDLLLPQRCEEIRKALRNERTELTLKDVYGILMSRKHNNETNCFNKSRLVRRLFVFIRLKMGEYGVDRVIPDGVTSFVGSEFMYGCLCLQLLGGVPENTDLIISKEICVLLLDSMRKQTDEEIAQHAVLTAVDLCSNNTRIAQAMSQAPGAPATFTWIVARGREATKNDLYDAIEDMLIPRVRIVELTALTRKVYVDTDIMRELIRIWDDYDYYWYGDIQVQSVQDLKKLYQKEKKAARKENRGKAQPIPATGPGGEVTSPLERRKSVVGKAAEVAALEKRKSVLQGGKTNGQAGVGGLARRASAVFTAASAEPPGRVPPNKHLAMLQQQQQQGSPLKRRLSMLGGAKVTAAPPPQTSRPHASQMQRRASQIGGIDDPTNPAALKAVLNMKEGKSRKGDLQDQDSMGSNVSADFSAWSRRFKTTKSTRRTFSQSSFGSALSRAFKKEDLNDDDDGLFVPKMMEHVFKASRKVVCDKFIPDMVKYNCPMRLVGIVTDRESAPAMLPDVLFLIGILSGTREIKDDLGKLHAVERILDLLNRAYKHNGIYVSEVVANACLALANLCVVHRPNTKRLDNAHGVELIVKVLKTRGELNDAQGVNGASALICNLCYKNEDMKKSFGEKGAPAALVTAMRGYHSTVNVVSGARCIASLFKAVGNLALNESNMILFYDAKIEKAFEAFLSQADDEVDTATMEACLRTLANLVIEKDAMEAFQRVVMPLVAFMRKERNTTAEVHRWAFMTIANLCRHPENAKVFTRNQGIQTVMTILPFLQSSPGLKASVIYVLGIQTADPTNIPILIDNGVFAVIRDTLLEFIAALERHEQRMLEIKMEEEAAPPASTKGKGMTKDISRTVSKPTDKSGLTMQKAAAPRSHLLAGEAEAILELTQLPISALRCCQRMVKTDEAAKKCLKAEILPVLPDVVSTIQPMITYECLKVFFTLLKYNWSKQEPVAKPPDFATLVQTEQIKYMFGTGQWTVTKGYFNKKCLVPASSDPGQSEWKVSLPPQCNAQRNIPPRLYQNLKFAHQLPDMVVRVRKVLSSLRAQKHLRLQRVGIGLLAYCAAEKVAVPSLFQRLNAEIDPDTGLYVIDDEEERRAQKIQKHLENQDSPNKGLTKRKSMLGFTMRQKSLDARIDKDTEDMDTFGRDRIEDPTSIVDILRSCFCHLWVDLDLMEECCLLLNNLMFLSMGHEQFANAIADIELYKQMTAMMRDKRKAYLESAANAPQNGENGGKTLRVFRKKPEVYPTNQTRRSAPTQQEDAAQQEVRGVKLMVKTLRNYKRFLQTEGKMGDPMSLLGDGPPANDPDSDKDVDDFFSNSKPVRSASGNLEKEGSGSRDPAKKPVLKSRRSILPIYFGDEVDAAKDLDESKKHKLKYSTLSDLEQLFQLVTNEYDLELSQHHIDPYPDGVQSLPPLVRNQLRMGGRFDAYDATHGKCKILWRGSHDLVMLEWKFLPINTSDDEEVDPAFPYSVAVSRINRLSGGLDSEELIAAAQQDRGISASRCLVIGGPAVPAFPKGIVLSIKCRDQRERDNMLQLVGVWREASAFGFM